MLAPPPSPFMLVRPTPRALLFADGNFLAHVSRLLEIARVLRGAHGMAVAFAGEGRYLSLVRDDGFEVHPCFTVPKERTLALARRGTIVDPWWWHRVVSRSIGSDIELIERLRPEVVVGDMHWSLRAASLKCGVPYVSVVNASWTNYFSHPIAALDEHVLTALLGREAATRAFPVFRQAALWYWALPYKVWRLRNGNGALPARNLLDVVAGDLTLFADVPEFCPTRNLPPSARYVGPILWKPRLADPPWLAALDAKRPSVYVSMGSTGGNGLFETTIEAFRGSDYQVLMTMGELALPPTVPPNVFVTDFAAGERLLARSDVCINHGGNGTVYQSLSAGVPVVGVPTHIDQQIQLQLCERSGVGRRLSPRGLTPSRLRQAVDEVRSDLSHRRNAQALAAVIARYDGAQTAARAVADLVGQREDHRPRSEAQPAEAEWPSS
jgi:UDP:flavonoid glycosyltransferase YjiC (YdhE family)